MRCFSAISIFISVSTGVIDSAKTLLLVSDWLGELFTDNLSHIKPSRHGDNFNKEYISFIKLTYCSFKGLSSFATTLLQTFYVGFQILFLLIKVMTSWRVRFHAVLANITHKFSISFARADIAASWALFEPCLWVVFFFFCIWARRCGSELQISRSQTDGLHVLGRSCAMHI